MAREGIEMVFDITDRSNNVLIRSTSHTTRIFCEFVEEKTEIEHVYFSRLEGQRTLSLSLSLSLSSHEMVRAVLTERVIVTSMSFYIHYKGELLS